MKLSIIGTGNVGLVTGACFSARGHEVRCADIDAEKVDQLQRLEFHSEEPGLTDLVARRGRTAQLHHGYARGRRRLRGGPPLC